MRSGPFLVLSLLMVIFWAESFLLLHVASFLIHLLLLVAVLFFVGYLLRETTTTT
jgi:hypothetical protein